ncbi:LysM peptidoglycan-binding domain-containing protein [Roseibium alexandrii]|uniref:LysM peptidoglycan-binding domain-containing protein n=1 Tax=Roseibium alexandrii TaxID=388408 RepID=UPI00375019A0
MNKQTLIRTLIIAVPVGVAALITGYFYRDSGGMPVEQERADSQVPGTTNESSKGDQQTSAAPDQQEVTSKTEVQEAESPAAAPEEPEASETAEVSDKPSFDVVGVEPTGETVVAGRSEAGAIVALTANGEVVGKTIANPAGEWTIILDEPLKPGDYDVALEVHDQGGEQLSTSDERVAISIPDGGKQQPLVVLNSPDGPSNVLQKPEAPVAVAEAPKAEETVVAAAPASEAGGDTPSSSPAENVTAAAGNSEGAAPAVAETTETAAASSAEAESALNQTATADARQPTADSGSGQAEQTAEAAATSTAPETEATAEPTETTTAAATDAPASSGDPDLTDTNQQVAAASQAETTASAGTGTQGGQQPVTVEAVESEEDKVYVAGTAEPGSSVRVYVGDDYQGEAKANSSGRWLLEGDKSVAEGNVEVRADMIAEDGKSVGARAAVTFAKQQDEQIVLTKVVASGTSGSAEGEGADVKKALPVVIIRKGDNLWRISRRLYGDGIRYTTIYQANKGQIRDPDLIYPGQVFLTPEGDLNWPAPDADTDRNG